MSGHDRKTLRLSVGADALGADHRTPGLDLGLKVGRKAGLGQRLGLDAGTQDLVLRGRCIEHGAQIGMQPGLQRPRRGMSGISPAVSTDCSRTPAARY